MGTHRGSITKKADAALTTRGLLVKFGTDVDHIAVNGASDKPLGICDDTPAIGEDCGVQFLGNTDETREVIASEAITLDDGVLTAAAGKVQAETGAASGSYFRIGRALQAAAADDDVIEIESHHPEAVTVA